jgi:hypothetical protein
VTSKDLPREVPYGGEAVRDTRATRDGAR